MMSKNDERKIIDSLANDKTLEMNADDLEQMLSDELAKPEEEIDAQLVQEILNALEPSMPDPAQMRDAWPRIKEHLPKRREKKRWPAKLARIAAAAAVISIVLVSTIEDAGAFRWTLIRKLLKPVAQTFGIIIDDQTDVTPEATQAPVYSVSDAPSTLITYAALDEVPEMHEGYVVRPRWLPEGFVFSTGSRFTSVDSEIYSLDFLNGERWLGLSIHIITRDDAVYSHEFERTLDVPIERNAGSYTVTFYTNTEETVQSAFWIQENAHYRLTGDIRPEDVLYFAECMD